MLRKGENPFQDADSLIDLRNALTHYKSEWDDSPDRHGRLEARLKGRFAPNPFAKNSPLWFPHHCLGAGCADWAVKTSEWLLQEFSEKLGLRSDAALRCPREISQ